jgi:selenocysteine-specific elongation factor
LRTAAGRTRFEQLNAAPDAAASVVRALVAERGASGFPRSSLVSRLGLSAPASASVVNTLVEAGAVTAIGASLVATATLDGLSNALVDAVRARHASRPLDEGLAREEARERLFAYAAPGVFDYVVDRLTVGGVLEATSVLALSGHRVSLSNDDAAAMAAVERVFRESGLAPPDAADAARQAGVASDVALRVTQLLVRRKRLVRLDGLHYHAERLDALKQEMRGLRETGTIGVDVGTFKERYGLSRKYAIPLLEYLDRERVTRRAGASRVLV